MTNVIVALGGTLRSFFRINTVALKDGGGVMLVRKADDSAYAKIQASAVKLSTGAGAGLVLVSDATGNGTWTALSMAYPHTAVVWHRDSTKSVGNNLITIILSTQAYGHYVAQSPSALNDAFFSFVVIEAGTYTFEAFGHKSTSSGIVTWYLDGVSIGSQDWYGAAADNVSQTIASLTIAVGGAHSIKGVVLGKNASSSGYNIPLTRYSFIRNDPTP